MTRAIKREKKIIKDKPRHPRPSKDVRWTERKEEKPARKKARKLAKIVEREQIRGKVP